MSSKVFIPVLGFVWFIVSIFLTGAWYAPLLILAAAVAVAPIRFTAIVAYALATGGPHRLETMAREPFVLLVHNIATTGLVCGAIWLMPVDFAHALAMGHAIVSIATMVISQLAWNTYTETAKEA